MIAPYTLKDAAPLIKCPTLVVDSDNDTLLPGQARPLYDALTISNERIFNWLDGVLQEG